MTSCHVTSYICDLRTSVSLKPPNETGRPGNRLQFYNLLKPEETQQWEGYTVLHTEALIVLGRNGFPIQTVGGMVYAFNQLLIK